jgi:putative transposase
MRKGHDAAFKARIALEAVKGEKTMAQLSSEYGVHANQIRQWRQRLLEEMPQVFSNRRRKLEKAGEEMKSELYRQIALVAGCRSNTGALPHGRITPTLP